MFAAAAVTAALLAALPTAAGAGSPVVWPRLAAFVNGYVAAELGRERSGALGSTSIRDMAAAALALLSPLPGAPPPSASNATDAAAMLDLVFSRQLASGQWPWAFSSAVCTDTNAVQFIMLPALLAAVHAAPLLPAGWLAGKLPAVERGAAASFAEGDGPHTEAQPYYTNIATMRLAVLTLAAQVTGNATLAALAAGARADFTALVDAAGVHEYSSPTYSAVTIHNLYAAAGAVADAAVARTLRRYATFILAHVAAVAWAPAAAAVGGAHSRDYDFITGTAGVGWVLLLTGLANTPVGDDSSAGFEDPITMAELYLAALRGELPAPAPAPLPALAATPPRGGWRVARSTWSATAGAVPATAGSDAYFFASAVATLGTSSLYYNGQDREVVAQLALCSGCAAPAPSPRLAQVSLVQVRAGGGV